VEIPDKVQLVLTENRPTCGRKCDGLGLGNYGASVLTKMFQLNYYYVAPPFRRKEMKDIAIGTLCWFWDGDEDERVIGQYGGAGITTTHFNIDTEIDYNHCRPVKRDEIKLEGDEE
jgi:hypothetical protein